MQAARHMRPAAATVLLLLVVQLASCFGRELLDEISDAYIAASQPQELQQQRQDQHQQWRQKVLVQTRRTAAQHKGNSNRETTLDDGADGRYGYIVMLTDSPTVSYSGDGPSGLAATAAAAQASGQGLDMRSTAVQAYTKFLETQSMHVAARAGAAEQVLYTYKHALSGFHVRSLTRAQLMALAKDPAVAYIAPNTLVKALTVGTPNWLGLVRGAGNDNGRTGGVWRRAFGGADKAGEGVVIGVIDSGIYPDHPSFYDKKNASNTGPFDYTPVDKSLYNGECTPGEKFDPQQDCNRKLVGCQFFGKSWNQRVMEPAMEGSTDRTNGPVGDVESCLDVNGHGTHTAATAAGNFGVPFLAGGVLSGMAPKARIASYKALWTENGVGLSSDLIAAVDKAIADGVSVINLSLGGPEVIFPSPLALAYMRAARAGIFIASAAGNDGDRGEGVVQNAFPWVTTVAAAVHNRMMVGATAAKLIVKDGEGAMDMFEGASWFSPTVDSARLALAEDVALIGKAKADARLCLENTLDPAKVKSKIIVCDRGNGRRTAKSLEVKRAGGIGMVLLNANVADNPDDSWHTDSTYSDQQSVPTIHLASKHRDTIRLLAAKPRATATLEGVSFTYNATAPLVAGFSSPGPDNGPLKGAILKPDVAAPGQEILAAYSKLSTDFSWTFSALSGTSMATPHIAGLAALVRQQYPKWSPMAIKSALMTTAYRLTKSGVVGLNIGKNPFHYGSGHVDPTKMLNPGLVFDSSYDDWARLVCTTVTQDTPLPSDIQKACEVCKSAPKQCDPVNFNTPSIAVTQGWPGGSVTVIRTVTSVLKSPATFKASTAVAVGSRPYLSKLSVQPESFRISPGETQRLEITMQLAKNASELDAAAAGSGYTFGWIKWSTDTGSRASTTAVNVRIPVAVKLLPALTAPEEVTVPIRRPGNNSTTVSSQYTYSVLPGYTGTLALRYSGLMPADVSPGTVLAGETVTLQVLVPEGLPYVRFSMYAADLQPAGEHDLDLTVLYDGAEVGSSADFFTADETVVLREPAPGVYTVAVKAYQLVEGTPQVNFYVHVWLYTGKEEESIDGPDSVKVAGAREENITLSITNVNVRPRPPAASKYEMPLTRYLGDVVYARGKKGLGNTTVLVDPNRVAKGL